MKMRNGDLSACEKLIQSNLKLVVSKVKKYTKGLGTLEIFDLIQEGNKGLIRAIDRFDPSYNCRISTYAIPWINHTILRAIQETSRNIRIPHDILGEVNIYKRIEDRILKETGNIPTVLEVAHEMKISYKKAIVLYKLQHDTVSINTLLNGREDVELGDLLLNTELSSEEEFFYSQKEQEFLDLIKECDLTEKELEILILKFVFLGNTPKNKSEIGKIYGVTRERIRQIEKKAFEKIKESEKIKELLVYGTTARKI